MLLININNILYKLWFSRSFVIKAGNNQREMFLANNTVCFVLPKRKNLLARGTDTIYGFDTLQYKDEHHQHLLKDYPTLLNASTRSHLIIGNLLKNLITRNNLRVVVVKRSRSRFLINCIGVNVNISFFSFFNNFCKNYSLTSQKGFFFRSSRILFESMLYLLNTSLTRTVFSSFLTLKLNETTAAPRKKVAQKKNKKCKHTRLALSLLQTFSSEV